MRGAVNGADITSKQAAALFRLVWSDDVRLAQPGHYTARDRLLELRLARSCEHGIKPTTRGVQLAEAMAHGIGYAARVLASNNVYTQESIPVREAIAGAESVETDHHGILLMGLARMLSPKSLVSLQEDIARYPDSAEPAKNLLRLRAMAEEVGVPPVEPLPDPQIHGVRTTRCVFRKRIYGGPRHRHLHPGLASLVRWGYATPGWWPREGDKVCLTGFEDEYVMDQDVIREVCYVAEFDCYLVQLDPYEGRSPECLHEAVMDGLHAGFALEDAYDPDAQLELGELIDGNLWQDMAENRRRVIAALREMYPDARCWK